MSFRARLLFAFAITTLLSLSLFAVGVRRQLTARLATQNERRVQTLARVAIQDLSRENAEVSVAGRRQPHPIGGTWIDGRSHVPARLGR